MMQKTPKNIETIEKKPSIIDPRNTLNDLTGSEWLPETKSFFYQKGLGSGHPHAQIEKLHPAPFSFQDIMKLILFFTKRKAYVLDPFGGVGSTAKACALTDRICTSIELSLKWHELSIKRIATELENKEEIKEQNFINNDCITELKKIKDNSFDFIVTSPPYWAILNKKADHKVKSRVDQKLDTNYSNNDKDLGNIDRYEDFLNILTKDVFIPCGRVLKEGKYMCIIVSDFRNKSEYISFHSDLIQQLKNADLEKGCKLKLQGTKILAQNHKSLLPYGYPFAYVENIHHQYILIFRKQKKEKNNGI